jgi:hypothetical protein
VFMVSLPRHHLLSNTDNQDSNSLQTQITEMRDISLGCRMERGVGI